MIFKRQTIQVVRIVAARDVEYIDQNCVFVINIHLTEQNITWYLFQLKHVYTAHCWEKNHIYIACTNDVI